MAGRIFCLFVLLIHSQHRPKRLSFSLAGPRGRVVRHRGATRALTRASEPRYRRDRRLGFCESATVADEPPLAAVIGAATRASVDSLWDALPPPRRPAHGFSPQSSRAPSHG